MTYNLAPTAPLVFAFYELAHQGPYGNTLDGYTQDIEDAQRAGVDGFALDMFGWLQSSSPWANFPLWTQYMFTAAANLGTGFKLYFVIDDQQYGATGQTMAGTMMGLYYQHPNYWNFNGRPVMGAWSASCLGAAGSVDNTFWSGVLSAVAPYNVFFWPNFNDLTNAALTYNDPAASVATLTAWFNPWLKSVCNGIASWNAYLPDPIYPNNAAFSTLAATNNIPFMANISSWLSEIRFYWLAYNGGTAATIVEFLEYNGFEGMSNIWLDIIQNNRALFVCLNTWNDSTESYMGTQSQAQATVTMTNWSAFTIWASGSGGTSGLGGNMLDNVAVDSDGGLHAASWARIATTATYTGSIFPVKATSLPYTFTIKAKAGTGTFLSMRLQGVYPHRVDVTFLLTSTGSIATAATATSTMTTASASITLLNNGWYLCSVTATSVTDTNLTALFSFASTNVAVDGTDTSATSSGFVYNATLSQGVNPFTWTAETISPDYMYSHAAFTELNRYFIQWFKTGAQPSWPDSMYVSYRKAAMSVVPSLAPALPVPSWNQQGHNATLDDIYITTILTAPATLAWNTGGSISSATVAGGLVHTRVPFTAGATQTFSVTRNSLLLMSIVGDPIVSTLTYYYNSNPLTYYTYATPPTRVITAGGRVTQLLSDSTIVINQTTPAAISVQLMYNPGLGQTVTIKDGAGIAATFNITISPAPASGNIDGNTTYVIGTNYGGATLVFNGVNWNVTNVAVVLPKQTTQSVTATGQTIAVGVFSSTIITTTTGASMTGMILGVGSYAGQVFTIVNTTAFTIVFAASGTSHVFGTPTQVANVAQDYVWDGTNSLWRQKA